MKKLFGKLAALILIFVIGVIIAIGWGWLNDQSPPLQVLIIVLLFAASFMAIFSKRGQSTKHMQHEGFRDTETDDLFGAFFGSAIVENGDSLKSVMISKNKAAHGCVKTLDYKIRKYCEKCSGTGVGAGGSTGPCPKCNGEGGKTTKMKTMFGDFHSAKHCKKCDGRGKIIERPCEQCDGYGGYEAKEQQFITIPANISETSISIQGKGHYIDANTRGNLVVTVIIADG